MNKSYTFKAAHQLARHTVQEGDCYRAVFAICLSMILNGTVIVCKQGEDFAISEKLADVSCEIDGQVFECVVLRNLHSKKVILVEKRTAASIGTIMPSKGNAKKPEFFIKKAHEFMSVFMAKRTPDRVAAVIRGMKTSEYNTI